MKKVRNFKDLKQGVMYESRNKGIYYFVELQGNLAMFIKVTLSNLEDEPIYEEIHFNKNEIKALRYDL